MSTGTLGLLPYITVPNGFNMEENGALSTTRFPEEKGFFSFAEFMLPIDSVTTNPNLTFVESL